jgi:anti-sigma B factor antagonist
MADRTYREFPQATDLETSSVRAGVSVPASGEHEPPIANIQVISDSRPGSVTVVSVTGEVDAHSAAILRRELLGVIAGGAEVVVVDLDAATFIDSVMLGVLLGAVRRLQNRRGELRVACANRAIRRIFEITQLDRVLALYASRDDALAATSV